MRFISVLSWDSVPLSLVDLIEYSRCQITYCVVIQVHENGNYYSYVVFNTWLIYCSCKIHTPVEG